MKIVNVGNKSIHLYLLDSGTHRLLIDAGFPGQLHELGRKMRETGFKIREIDYLLVTHFHVDHAGALQEIKNEGVKFILFDIQAAFIKPMEDMTIGKWPYLILNRKDNLLLPVTASKNFLEELNIQGQVISTPGHSDDSVSLVLDSGEAFIGDLPPEHLITETNSAAMQSWNELKTKGAIKIYPSHGNEYSCI
jgi:glyoxylase-like metal-dependent hydrolase (beta-lactamase superfamily II)